MFRIDGKTLEISTSIKYEAESRILFAKEFNEGIVVCLDFSHPLSRQSNIRLIGFSGELVWSSAPPDMTRTLSGYDCYVGILEGGSDLVGITAAGFEDQLDIKTGRFVKLVRFYK